MNQTAQEFTIEGIEKCKSENFEEAIALFDKAISLQPDLEQALYNRAKAHFRIKNYGESIEDFTTLLIKHPTNAFYYSERGVALHLAERSDEALQDLNRAAELEPNKPFRYSSRAFIKDRMGDLKGAIADYEKAIELDPKDAISYNNKGLVEEKLGYKERSQSSFQKADNLDPAKAKSVNKTADAVDSQNPTKSTIQEVNHQVSEDKKEEIPSEVSSEKNSVGFKGYLKQVKAIFNDKNERSEFNEFLKQFFSRKN